MTNRQQWLLVGALVLALAGGALAVTRLWSGELFAVTVGSHAPRFEARTLDSTARVRTLDDYRGKVLLLNIWATWCGPCVVEMPAIEKLHRTVADSDFHVVAISIDRTGAEREIQEFARELGLTFEILHDASGRIQRVYQTTGVPETFVIGRDGIIRKKVIGARDWSGEGERALVAQLLAEGRP